MSFSGDIKEELLQNVPLARHCKVAELAAIFLLCGHVRVRNLLSFTDSHPDLPDDVVNSHENEKYRIEIRTENLTVAKKSYILIRDIFHTVVEVRVRNHNIRGRTKEYFLVMTERKDVISFLKTFKLMDVQGSDSRIFQDVDQFESKYISSLKRLIQQSCCKRAFLRGAFLTAGSLSDPKKAYHLEIAVLSDDFARQIQKLMGFYGLDAKIVARKKYQVVYIKEGEQIADFLNVIEAHVALMAFENIRIVKEVRNSVNRRVNCETANIGKTVKAAAKQVADIKYIECNMGLRKLAKGLQEIAELRLDYPDISLQELGRMLDPPIGKSGVNHRLRKLGEIADELREKTVDFSPKKEDM